MTLFDLFRDFKSAAADLEFTDDTVELDRRLGKVSALLYKVGREIDDIWCAERAKRKAQRAVKPPSLDLDDPEIAAIINNFIKDQQQ
jgi:hypothetical protein